MTPSFSALQRAENSSISIRVRFQPNCRRFSALQRAENSSIKMMLFRTKKSIHVSVLFSEPKIPQLNLRVKIFLALFCFSALQRAENSSIKVREWTQTSRRCFSALQRAENSSICTRMFRCNLYRLFQCSSASRKFLNAMGTKFGKSNKSVSVLFSEPKIPQCQLSHWRNSSLTVSVLFSEPKIPQFYLFKPDLETVPMFQCSSASRKFLNLNRIQFTSQIPPSFSALQRAENSSIARQRRAYSPSSTFQCSSASRKFLNRQLLRQRW